VREFEDQLYKYVDTSKPGLLNEIMEKKTLDDQLKAEMTRLIKEAKQQFVSSRETAKAIA
jgi:F-type H+/Na+-transporting ATPase subunit alpha